jgi:uncharacterized protein (TIGR03435 family)
MLFRKRCFPFLLAVFAAAHGQDRPMTFEVASVKISPPVDHTKPPNFGCTGGPGTTDPGLYVCHYATLQGLVIEAFGLASYQFSYVPSRDHTAYDIEAKVPSGATREELRGMLQSLLAERLKLAYHFEKKQAQVYALAIANNGAKLQVSPPESAEKPQPAASPVRDEYGFRNPPADFKGQVMSANSEVVRWMARGVTTAQMAKMLATRLQGPVTDSTGLGAKYDFTLYFSAASVGFSPGPALASPTPGDAPRRVGEEAAEGISLPSVFVVLQDKLGLTIERTQGFFDLFVVDHVEKVPAEN